MLVLAFAGTAASVLPVPAAGTGASSAAPNGGNYIAYAPTPGGFPLVSRSRVAPLVVSGADYPGVVRAVSDLRTDTERVTGIAPTVEVDRVLRRRGIVLVGTIGRSPLIDRLVARRQAAR